MMIRIDIIRILQAVEGEYGTNELLHRIYKIFHINLMHLIDQDPQVIYMPKSIQIIPEEEFPRYKVELEDEYYTFQKEYATYTTTHYYDREGNEFRKSISFPLENQEQIVLDETDSETYKSRRIMQTTQEDKDLIKGMFEKEQFFYHRPPITEEYTYIEGKISKVIHLPGNLCVYTKRPMQNKVTTEFQEGSIECACSINKPYVIFLGRVRSEYELLAEVLKKPLPNIVIKGFVKEQQELNLFLIQIYKLANVISVKIVKNNLRERSQVEEKGFLSKTSGPFTIDDISLLQTKIEYPIGQEIQKELTNLKQQLQINAHQRVKEVDFFDLRFGLFDRFEDLALDLYENLPIYEQKIKEICQKTEEEPPTLKKR